MRRILACIALSLATGCAGVAPELPAELPPELPPELPGAILSPDGAELTEAELVAALEQAQAGNDALTATTILKMAFRTNVDPILAVARADKGNAIDPIATFRASGYRAQVAKFRPKIAPGSSGIV